MSGPNLAGTFYWRHGVLRQFAVLSPWYSDYRGDYEPPDSGRDHRLVWARTARRAKLAAVRAWRHANGRRGLYDARDLLRGRWLQDYNDEHPLKITAQEVEMSFADISA